jgi:FkbH-like protein
VILERVVADRDINAPVETAMPADEQIKLVIWDLDETFWMGTLSEGGSVPIAANIQLVKALSARGIVNSICSKNDFVAVQQELTRLGIWEFFIFPRVAFAPKGAMITEIIEAAQLRAASILFVDDNVMNLKEALHYNPGLQLAGPDILPGLLDDPRCKGKPDPVLDRLAHYKVLEQKQTDQSAAGGDNTEFLRSSQIRISFHYDILEQFPRIHDLVNRTNQLNFTKLRWPEDEKAALAAAKEEYKAIFNSHWGYVKVADRYGNYGICGFFMLRYTHARHFLFSCRSMNMGVEQYVWHKLGKPDISISGEVSSTLGSLPDWITVVEDADVDAASAAGSGRTKPVLCMRGACDLNMMTHYLRTSFDTIEEYQYPYEGWAIHRQAREIALSDELESPALRALLAKTPSMPSQRFDSAINTAAADVYVLSFSSEIFGGHMRSRSTGAILPMWLGGLGERKFADLTYEQIKELNGQISMTAEEWGFLQEEYEPAVFLDPVQLCTDLNCLFNKLVGKLVIVLQLNSTVGTGKWQLKTYERINEIVLPVALAHGCTIIDMAEFVRSSADLVDPEDFGVHYSREVYRRLAARVEELAGSRIAAEATEMPVPQEAKPATVTPPIIKAASPAANPSAMITEITVLPMPQCREINMKRHLIGLGFRCDVAFQLRMHGSENVAHFFDWLATPIDGVIQIIKADFDVFYPDHLVLNTNHSPHCVEDRMTGTLFHHQFPLYAGHMQADYLLFYEPFINKFQHLADRFRLYMETKPVTLVRQDITREQALQLEEAVLERFPNADVRFFYAVDKAQEFETPYGKARALRNDGTSLGDPAEWARVLSEEGLIDEPYRHGTAQILGAAHDDYNLSTDNRFSEEQLLNAIKANPQSAFFPLELSRLYELKGMWRKSEEMAVETLARAPHNLDALFQATLAQWKLNEIPVVEAAQIFERLAAHEKPQVRWMREAAASCLAAARTEDALRYANKAVCADPADQRNYLQKVLCLYRQHNLVATELALAAAMRLGPVGHTHLHIHAKILDWRGDADTATQVERGIVKSNPNFFPSMFHLAELSRKAGRVSEALEYYQAALLIAGVHRDTVEKKIAELSAMNAPVASGVQN